MLQILCEQIDERVALRVTVLRDGLADDRRALRALDTQIDEALDWLDDEVTRAALQEVSLVDEL